jgi:hypothetical protein
MQHYKQNTAYLTFRALGYVFGFISLMSFWIMLLISTTIHDGNKGFLTPIMYSPMLAVVTIAASLICRSAAVGIRLAWEDAQKADKAQSHS